MPAGVQLPKVVGKAVPCCVTVSVGAVPSPDVRSKPEMVMVTSCPIPPGAPAGLGVALTTVKLGGVWSITTDAVTAVWLTWGVPCPAQHQLPNESSYSTAMT